MGGEFGNRGIEKRDRSIEKEVRMRDRKKLDLAERISERRRRDGRA